MSKYLRWQDYELTPSLFEYTTRLPRGETLSGFVTDEDGNPVRDASIALSGSVGSSYSPANRDNIAFHPKLSSVSSGQDGSWSLSELPSLSSGSIKMIATHPDFAATTQWISKSDLTNPVIVLSNGVPFFGRVLATNGIPIVRASVSTGHGAYRSSRTDAEGRFSWPRVHPGKMWIRIVAEDRQEFTESV